MATDLLTASGLFIYNNLLGIKGAKTLQQNELITSLGTYFQNETKLNDIAEITLGVRHDDVTFDVRDKFLADGDDSGKISLNQFSPMIGISLKTSSNTNIYATVSKAFETPTTTEFANPSGGGFNQAVKPQKSTNYEIGIKKLSNKYTFEAAIFQINVRDELTPYEDSEQPGRTFFTNAGSSDRHGLELTNIRRFYDQFEFSTTYTYSDFKFNHFKDDNGIKRFVKNFLFQLNQIKTFQRLQLCSLLFFLPDHPLPDLQFRQK